MKVLIVVPAAERLGGAENLLLTLLRHADSSRLEPTVCFLRPGPFERDLHELGISTITTDAGRLRDVRRFAATVVWLARVMRARSPDIVLAWMQKSQFYCAPAAALAGMTDRLVWWQHDIPRREWRNVLATALPARAVGTISQSAAAAQEHLRPHRDTFVVGAGIEPRRSPSPDEVARLRGELQIPAGRFVIGIVARLQRWKGQHHVLAATALLRERGHDVHCLVVGGDADGQEPSYTRALHRQARELGLAGVATFTGQVEDPAPYLGLMHVAVNASDAEPFGISLLEAMAAGVPAVAVDAGGPAEILANNHGLLVEHAAPDQFADAIERLIVQPDLRSRLAARGAELAASEFDPARGARELEAALTALGPDINASQRREREVPVHERQAIARHGSWSTATRLRHLLDPLVRRPIHPGGRRAAFARRAGARLGFHVLPEHYYSPVPNVDALPADVFDRITEMPGVVVDAEHQVEFLETGLARYVAEFPQHGPADYDFENGGYESVDAEVLYAMIRHQRPRRVVEVGTGYSTLVTAAAAHMNAAEDSPVRFTSIDPHPTENTGELPGEGLEVDQWPMRIQDVPLHEFEQLEAGDIFFVDGTHTVVIGGDVTFVMLEVLPRLRPGVLVHFHDIYLPYEYPRFFIERFAWNEQYLLQAFLACNQSYEVVIGNHHVARAYADRVAAVVPSFRPPRYPSAYWMRRC